MTRKAISTESIAEPEPKKKKAEEPAGFFSFLFGSANNEEEQSDNEEKSADSIAKMVEEVEGKKKKPAPKKAKLKDEEAEGKKDKKTERRKSVWDSMREAIVGEEKEESSDEDLKKEELKPDYAGKILVTGAEGFIAGHVIKLLLEKNFHVVGTVRTLRNEGKHAHLLNIAPEQQSENPDVLELVEADLSRTGTFDAAVDKCEYIIHIASPFKLGVRDAKVGLINPAVQGTLAILAAAQKCGHIKRVVITSCTAAVVEKPGSREYSESDWNEASNVESYAYHASKTAAEKQAYDFVKKLPADSRFELVSVLPSMVIGPILAGENTTMNTSLRIITDMIKGLMPWIPNVGLALVDVRDVARAHVAALVNPNANGRYICHCDTLPFSQVCDIIRPKYPKGKVPIRVRGKFFTRRNEIFKANMPFQYIRPWLGKTPKFSNRKIKKDLGIDFIPVEKSILDMIESFNKFNI